MCIIDRYQRRVRGLWTVVMESDTPLTYGLRPKVLTSILQEAADTQGVEMSMLMQSDGSLIALAAQDRTKANKVAAIVSNIWSSYDKVALERLECVLLDNEERRLAVQSVGGNGEAIVCLVAHHSAPFGMLKAMVNALVQHLDEPVNQLSTHLQ
eukprot:TRINITY_DN4336_c0_g1_i2.p1 TRINITY_DN4336_c0_g1~~TRINITY_DN4336_c0_g1_i2.p1  ORF type:complete len:154 (+),score=38.24 TRINITY_DN4336_c0_g1_i2:107-568(+)